MESLFYIWKNTMEQTKLNEVRGFLQWLLDKYLEPDQRFSLEEVDENMLFLLIDLLLEKNSLERGKIWTGIEQLLIESYQWLVKDYKTIMEIKNGIILKKLKRQEKERLKELDSLEEEFDEKLKDI